MTKLIIIWLFQKLTYIAEAVRHALTGLTICLFLFAICLTIFYYVEGSEIDAKIKEIVSTAIKRLYKFAVFTLVLTFGALITKAVRLSDTEYKTAIVYCIGSEIMKSSIGEKTLDVVDAKLQSWLELINKSNPNNQNEGK